MLLATKTRNVIGASLSVYCHSLIVKQSFTVGQIVSPTYQFIMFSRYGENIIKRMEEVSLLLLFFKIRETDIIFQWKVYEREHVGAQGGASL